MACAVHSWIDRLRLCDFAPAPVGHFGRYAILALPQGTDWKCARYQEHVERLLVVCSRRWPLLAVTAPNWPQGANAERFDIVPVVALLGKIFYTLTGQVANPYPWWVTGCFTLYAAAFCSLVRGLGQRGLLAAVTSGAFAAMAPFVQARFGHLALMAHWLPIFMLSWYFHRPKKPAEWTGILALCALAAAVHLYLFVMTAAIATAIFLQAMIDKRCTVRLGAAAVIGILASAIITMWMLGVLQDQDLGGITGDYRRYSMNLLSPLWPQTSGLFGRTGM